MHFDTAALIAIIALFACFFVWLMWARYAPLRLALVDESASGSFAGAADTSGLGKVGELVTALMMAKDGWQKLPSPRGGIDGLDGVFVKKIGGKQFDVRIVETKCARQGDAKSSYEAGQLADDRVIEQLERLKGATLADGGYIDDQAIEAIVKAIRRGSMHVSKQLYAHTLDEGQSLIYSVRPDGALIDRRASVKRVSGAPHRLMLHALASGLSRADAGPHVAVSSTPAE